MADDEEATTIPTLDIGEDDFAATRPPDNIFDLEPISQPAVPAQTIPTGPKADSRGGGRGGGRGRRGGRGGREQGQIPRQDPPAAQKAQGADGGSGLGSSRWGPASTTTKVEAVKTEDMKTEDKKMETVVEAPALPEVTEAEDVILKDAVIRENTEPAGETGAGEVTTEVATPAEAELEKKPEYPNRDRIGTGGIKKPKLSDSELEKRMAAIKLRNENLTKAHLLAAKDEERFMEAEQARKEADSKERVQFRKKKVETDKRRKELDAEREQNRQRKLKAVGNREWDSTKTEEDYNPANNSGYNPRFRRTAQGGIEGTISSPDASYSRADDNDNSNNENDDRGFSFRGRGGRGRGGRGGEFRGHGSSRGGGRGRGDGFMAPSAGPPANINSPADFPTLPPAKAPVMESIHAPPPAPVRAVEKIPISHGDGSLDIQEVGGTWAEQAEDAAEGAAAA